MRGCVRIQGFTSSQWRREYLFEGAVPNKGHTVGMEGLVMKVESVVWDLSTNKPYVEVWCSLVEGACDPDAREALYGLRAQDRQGPPE